MADTVITPAECEELAKRLEICWHYYVREPYQCSCGAYYESQNDLVRHLEVNNPDFLDPVVVLREMVKRADWRSFAQHIAYTAQGIEDYTIDTTGKVALAALEWLS